MGTVAAPEPKTEQGVKPALRVRLRNRDTLIECSPEVYPALKSYFRYFVPGARYSPKYRMGIWDGYFNYMKRGHVPTGLYLVQREALEEKFRLETKDERTFPRFNPLAHHILEGERPPRPFQLDALERMQAASNTGGLVLCATGTGKTITAALLAATLNGPLCFIVDELTLLDQTIKAFEGVLQEDIGIVGRGIFNPRRVTVATIQTLHAHSGKPGFQDWFRTLEILIIDEIHVQINRRNFDIVKTINPLAVFGLTATLQLQQRPVLMGATAVAGPVIFEYSIQDGMEEGYLERGNVTLVTVEQRGVWGDRTAQYQQMVATSPKRNQVIEGLVREGLDQGRRVVVLVERIAHLAELHRRFRDIPHKLASGAQDKGLRQEAVRDMNEGGLHLILSTRVFAKGVDIPTVDMIVDATGFPSANDAIQRYGRGTRRGEGKQGLLYFDIHDRSPKGVRAKEPGWNPFQRASMARWKALKGLGVPIRKVDGWEDFGELFV